MKIKNENLHKVKDFLTEMFKNTYIGYRKFEFTTEARNCGITNPTPIRKYLLKNDIIKYINGKYYWFGEKAPNLDMVHNILVDLNKPNINKVNITKVKTPKVITVVIYNKLLDTKYLKLNYNHILNSLKNHKYYDSLQQMIISNRPHTSRTLIEFSKIIRNVINNTSAQDVFKAMRISNMFILQGTKYVLEPRLKPEHIILAVKDYWKSGRPVLTYNEYDQILNTIHYYSNTTSQINDNIIDTPKVIVSTNPEVMNTRIEHLQTDLKETTKDPISDFLTLVESKRNSLFEELKTINQTKEELDIKASNISNALSALDTALSNINKINKTLNEISK